MHLYIKPTCIHKSPFLQSFLTHFMESLHYQPSLFNLITAKTFTIISAKMLCCKWNFHIHDCHKRPNNKAQPCRMFVQKGLTGGACFESVSGGGRSGSGDHCRELHSPHWRDMILLLSVGLAGFFFLVRHSMRKNGESRLSPRGWGCPRAQVSPLLWLLYHRAWQQPATKLPKKS